MNLILEISDHIEEVLNRLKTIITRLDQQIHQQSTPGPQEPGPTSGPHGHPEPHLDSPETCRPRSELRPESETFRPGSEPRPESETCRPGSEPRPDYETSRSGSELRPEQTEVTGPEEAEGHLEDKQDLGPEETSLSAQADGGGARPLVSDVCFVRAPPGVHRALVCEAVDALSFLMVGGAEELLSGVVRVGLRPGAVFPFPVAVAVPFSARYRGNYREVVVKVVDAERRVNYIHPVVTEGNCDGQRSSLAEVRVYALGLFAVVSRLKKETFTVPRTGSSFKLTTDPRVGLTYLPQSFTAPVMIQASVQPLDAVLLASVRSRTEVYHPVVSTSPMLYLTHPTSQPLRRTMTLTLPCPPNPTKKRAGPVEELKTRSVGGSLSWDHHVNNRLRALDRHVKASAEVSMDLLMVLVYRDKEWSLMEDVNVKNQQKGLVSMELTENIHRSVFLVLRLQSPVQPCHLLSLAEDLEDTARRHAVTVILQRQKDDPRAVLVSALPSRDLEWEVSRLRAQGYAGAVDASHEVSMCEGDQLILRFSGNITSTGKGEESEVQTIRVRLTQVDPFGNHSSQHYKGTAMFYKVIQSLPVHSVQSLPVHSVRSLPVHSVRSLPVHSVRSLPVHSVRSLLDSVLLWLSTRLSQEDVSLLVLSLRLRRSTVQLVQLRAGGSPASRAFQVLALWRRGLPTAPPPHRNLSHLASCLAKSGRPDLGQELLDPCNPLFSQCFHISTLFSYFYSLVFTS
uniref:Death domain containing 1 n=1 Tax=Sphaeramia orbicularis TaxID=375764 RepID=A0A673AYA3_9TELE